MKLLICLITAATMLAGATVPQAVSPVLEKIRFKNAIVEVEDADFHHEDNEIAFVFTYSNYAWVKTYTVTFVTCGGEKYSADFSDEGYVEEDELLGRLEKKLDSKKFASKDDKNLVRTCVLEAEQIDTSASYDRQSVACDAGSWRVYSAIGGELVLLCESGDWCGRLKDGHAERIVSLLKEAGLATVWDY